MVAEKLRDSPTSETVAPSAKIFGGYRTDPGVYDESALGPGNPRPHWRKFISSFEKLGREELAVRWENGRRIIREHGVTYNVYGDPQGMNRPWELDMVPLLIPPDEWRFLETGLTQRAKLFNLILADLYGPQRLLRDGLIPPALVFANPGFLRPCHGLRVPGEIYLHLHAVDLARSPDGQWWVLGDRTQSPSGSGYALENRIVLSRILPDEFRDSQVQRLASFFRIQRDALSQLATGRSNNPNIVLLTPGPHNETYFEHAYLARYLGFTLVEGGDLTVRDCRVFLKTLEGLQPVDVILRRVDDGFCDPLALRSDSFLGVPGLVEATHAGNVSIANALGSGMIESPAFLAFLPGLCRHILGEELKLPSVATWWCGQATEHQYVVDHLDTIVVKSGIATQARPPSFGARLNPLEKETLIAALRARPFDFVGQEQVALSVAPVWWNDQLEPRRISLRAYVAAHGDSYSVMPGGLTRVSPAAGDPIVSMQSGGGSKDTWVLSSGPVAPVSLLTASGQPVSVSRAAAELPSRVADNLFWLGRYVERLENRMRVLRCVIARMADEATSETASELAEMVQLLVRLDILPKRFAGRVRATELQQEILALVYNLQRAGSVRELGLRIRHIISVVRDRFSLDTWSILNQLQSDSRTRPGRIPLANALSLINTLIVDLAAFSGMEMENMTRGHGWRFLDFGRRLERGTNLINILSGTVPPKATSPNLLLEPLLEIADSSMTYRRRYLAQAQLPSVLELLVIDQGNPRSLAFQLSALADHADHLPQYGDAGVENSEQRRLRELTARLAQFNIAELASLNAREQKETLRQWLAEWSTGLSAVSNDLTHHYFSLTIARVS
ncbi:MAG: circularly permuted type 2 ATP-grasp protein [Verrucomicrobiota bacterium]